MQRIKGNLYWKMKFFKRATYIRYVIAKLLKYVQISHADHLRFLFTEDSLKIRKGLELVSRSHFYYNFLIKFFWPNFITKLCLLPNLSVKYASCFSLGIWWRHNIWIFKQLKFDFAKKENSFRSEIKNTFPCFTGPLF